MLKAKNKLAKRILALVLSGAMIFTSVAPSGITAVAAETSEGTGGEYQEETAEAGDTDDGEKTSEETSKNEDNASNKDDETKVQESSAETVESTKATEVKTEDEEQASETKSSLSEEKESAVKEEKESEEKTTVEEEEKDEKDEDVKVAFDGTFDKYADTFTGTVFGAITDGYMTGNEAKKIIIKPADDGTMYLNEGTGQVKLGGSADAFIMYYYKVDSGIPFTFKARMTVKSMDTASNQGTFGLMVRGDIADNVNATTLNSDYLAAAIVGKDNKAVVERINGSLGRGKIALSEAAAAGDVYDLEISRDTEGKYIAIVKGDKAGADGITYQSSLSISGEQYIGMYAQRKAEIAFDRIYLATGDNDTTIIMDQRADVTGNITGADTLADGTEITFVDADKKETKGTITKKDNAYTYSAKLYAGTYTVSVGDYDLTSGGTVTIQNKAAKNLDAQTNNIVLQEVSKVDVAGAITVPADAIGLDDLMLTFTKDGKDIEVTPALTGTTGSYSTKLAAGTYTVKVTAGRIEDYDVNVTASLTVGTSAITNNDISLTEKTKKNITVNVTSFDNKITELPCTIIFTRTGENDPGKGYTYEFSKVADIKLRDGSYSVKLEGIANDFAYALGTLEDITVSDSASSYDITFTKREAWDFTANDFMLTNTVKEGANGDQNYHGLVVNTSKNKTITGTYKDPTSQEALPYTGGGKFNVDTSAAKQQVQVNATTEIEIPVDGTGKIQIVCNKDETGSYTITGATVSSEDSQTFEYTNKPEGSKVKLQVIKTKLSSGQVAGDSIYLKKIIVTRESAYVPVDTVEVTGEIDFPDNTLPSGFKLVFASTDGGKLEATIDSTNAKPTYTVSLNKDTEYKISVEGTNDYEITTPSPATVTASEAKTVNITVAKKPRYLWNFRKGSDIREGFTESDNIGEGKTGTFAGLEINCTNNGKFNLTGNDDWAQINTGTVIKIPVEGACKVTIKCYADTNKYKIDGQEASGKEGTLISAGTDGWVTLEVTNGGYFDSIKIDPIPTIKVSGTVTGAPDATKVIFTGQGDASKLVFEGAITNDSYEAELCTGVTYTISLDEKKYAISSDTEVTIDASESVDKTVNITASEMTLQEVEGNIIFPSGKQVPNDLKLTFTATDGSHTADDMTLTGAKYKVELDSSKTYEVSVTEGTGIKDYELKTQTITASALDIEFELKTKYGVTVDPKTADGMEPFDIASKKITFTNDDPDQADYSYEFTGTSNIMLRNGTYSMDLDVPYPYMLNFPKVTVKDDAATLPLNFEERMAWDFTNKNDVMLTKMNIAGNQSGDQEYNGWQVDTSNQGGISSGEIVSKGQIQVRNGTVIKIPVSGKGTIQVVTAGTDYTYYTITGEEPATAADATYNYDVGTEATEQQYVTLTSTGNLYIKKVILTREGVSDEEEVTGAIVFPEGTAAPAELKITFTPENGAAVDATLNEDKTTYTVKLKKGVDYTISVSGANNYTFDLKKLNTNTAVSDADRKITFTQKAAADFYGPWSFKKGSKYFESGNTIKITEGQTGTVDGLEIDNTGFEVDGVVKKGKLVTEGRNEWAQANAGTIIKVPVKGPSKITTTWNGSEKYTIDGQEATGGSTLVSKGEGGYATIKITNGGYLGSIAVEEIPTVKISGNVTLSPASSEALKVVFTEKTDRASKFVLETEIKSGGSYEAELYAVEDTETKYTVSISDENYGVTVPEGAVVSVAKDAANITQDISASKMTLTKVTGDVKFPTGVSTPADLKLTFTEKDGTHSVEDVEVSENKYEVNLKSNTVYTVTATGTRIKDYKLVTEELDTSGTATDITFDNQMTYMVTPAITSFDDNAINASEIQLTFTNVNEEEYTYDFTGAEEIKLRDGIYSVSAKAKYPYVLDTPEQLIVNGANISGYALHFSKRTEWSFARGSSYMQGAVDIGEGKTGTLDGLEIDATHSGKFSTKGRDDWAQVNGDPTKDPATYTIIKVPADGPTEVTVKIYGGEKYTVDGVENNETENGKEETFVCQGTDGFATIIVTKGGYFGYIRVKAIEEVVVPDNRKIDVWDFGGKVEEDTNKYENHITAAKWISADLINTASEKPTFKADGEYAFDDLTITHKSGDRLYSELGNSDAEFKKLLYSISGSGSNKKYDDYQAVGAWYCAGTGSSDTRNITIKAIAGDKIVVYAGQHLSGSQYGPNTCYFEGQGLAKGQKDSVVLGSGQIFQKVEFIAEKSGSYKIWVECQGSGKAMYHRVMRIPGVKVSGTIDTKTYDIGSDYTVKFVNQTTKQETAATVEGKNFEVSLAGGYDYLAVLSGAAGYGFTSDSKNITIPADSPAITDKVLVVEQKSMYVYSGKFVGFADGYDVSRLAVTMVPPADSNADSVKLEINKETKAFNANLETGLEYTIQMEGVDDYVVSSASTINKTEDCEEDIAVRLKPRYEVTGGFIGLEGESKVTELKFTLLDEKGNPDSNYAYTATVNDSSYSIKLRDGEYVADATVSGGDYEKLDAHVTVAGEIVYKDLMFVAKTTGTIPRAADIYVGYPGKPNNYNTVREAVKAAERMTPKPANEEERITVHIAPGTYREQIIVNTPYITFTNDEAPKEVKITWYYGIGYAYYSAKNGFYDEARAHDKQIKGNVDKWGCAVQVKSPYFRAENIIFENSFNRYITEEEIADGVEVHTEGTDSGIKFVRKAGLTNAQVASKAATERAAAIAIDADHAEFYKCEFYGSQDTVYTGSGGVHSYFKECLLEGNTDFLFGDSNSVYDECELCFAGYSDTDKQYGGYIAVNQADSKHGYLFTKCTITRGKTYNNGFGDLGRPWRANARVIFADTTQMSADLITDAGWQDMSGASAKDNPNYYEYNTKLPDGTEIVPKAGSVRALKYKQPDVLPVKADYFDGWTPMYLTYDETKVVKEPVSSATSSDVETGTTIELSCATEGATIYYAIGENKPADDGWTPYEEGKPVSLGNTEGKVIVWAYAAKGDIKSKVTSFEYNVVSRENLIKAPEASVTPGEVEKGTTVTLSCETEGADIYFTTDGTEPTKKAELLYKKQAIVINKTTTIKAIAVKDTNVSDPVSEFTYTVKEETPVQVEAPTANVEQGKVEKGTKVTLTSATEGAYIRYTTDGSVPSEINGLEVPSPAEITIDKTTTITAVAVKEGCLDSASVTLTYTVEEAPLPTLKAVTATPATGTAVAKGAKVTLISADDADIYYTTDGKDPAANGTKAASPVEITIDKAVTIKAIARKTGYQDSKVAEFSYTITDTPSTKLTNPVATPDSGEVEKGTKVTLTSAEGGDIYYTTDGTDPTTNSTKYADAIEINDAVTIKAIAVKAGYDNSDVASYAYTIKAEQPDVRVEEPKPSVAQGPVDKGTKVELTCATEGAAIYYTLDGTDPTANSALYAAPIVIDRTVTIKAIAIKDNVESGIVSFTYTVLEVPAETVIVVRLEDCEIIVPSIIRNTSKKADLRQPSTTYVTYKYTNANGETKIVKFAEGLDYEVNWNGGNEDDTNTYSVTLTGLGRGLDGRTVDGFIIDENSTRTVEYKVIDKPSKNDPVKVVDISKAKITLDASAKNAFYTGYAIEPGIICKNLPTGLTEKDLAIAYRNNINAGKATVIVSAKPDADSDNTMYVGSKTLTFNIRKAKLNRQSTTLTAEVQVSWDKDFNFSSNNYTGTPITVKGLEIKTAKDKALKLDEDYTVTYKNNTKAGKATVTVKGIGNNVSGSWTERITINPVDMTRFKFDTEGVTLVYSPKGARLTSITATDPYGNQYNLKEGRDYTAKYTYSDKKTKAAGTTARVTISGKGACRGKNIEVGKFEIASADFATCIIVPDDIYADATAKNLGKALAKATVVKNTAGVKLKLGKDYTINYDAAAKTITLRPIDTKNYVETSQYTVKYRVAKNLAKERNFVFNRKASMSYDGRNPVQLTAEDIVKFVGPEYKLGVNIEIVPGSYRNNTRKGTGSVTVRGIPGVDGGFYGQKVLKFKIVDK